MQEALEILYRNLEQGKMSIRCCQHVLKLYLNLSLVTASIRVLEIFMTHVVRPDHPLTHSWRIPRNLIDFCHSVSAENTHLFCMGKYHSMAEFLLDWFGFYVSVNMMLTRQKQSSWIQKSKTGGRTYSDTSHYKVSEYSLRSAFYFLFPVWPDWTIYWPLGKFLKPLATICMP